MANMNDVAKLAGVSRGTVSNYINNVKVKEKSRIKIEAAIKELGYIPMWQHENYRLILLVMLYLLYRVYGILFFLS